MQADAASVERPTSGAASRSFADQVRKGWAQFQGPNRDGTSPETGLLRAWPEGGPKVLWKVEVGAGYGGAAVRDGEVYLLDREEPAGEPARGRGRGGRGGGRGPRPSDLGLESLDAGGRRPAGGGGRDILRCLDLAGGEERWRYAYDAPGKVSHPGSRQVPSVTEEYVYTIGPFGHVHCFDRKTHEVVWKKNLLTDYGSKLPRWAVSQSPLFYRDTMLVAPLSREAGLVALDPATGRELWRSEPLGDLGYVSPTFVRIGGVEQALIQSSDGVYAVDASNGVSLWRYRYRCRIPIPMPTVVGADRLFITGGYDAGSDMVRVWRSPAGFAAEQLWRNEEIGSHVQQPIVVGDHIYAVCNTNTARDGMVCFAAEGGKVVWQTGSAPYLDKGCTLLTGDGLFYQIDGRTGELYVIEPSPAGFKALDKVEMLSGKEIWAPMALADGKLVIRDQSKMLCLDVRSR